MLFETAVAGQGGYSWLGLIHTPAPWLGENRAPGYQPCQTVTLEKRKFPKRTLQCYLGSKWRLGSQNVKMTILHPFPQIGRHNLIDKLTHGKQSPWFWNFVFYSYHPFQQSGNSDRGKMSPSTSLIRIVKFTIPDAAQMKNSPLLQWAKPQGRDQDLLSPLPWTGGAGQTMRNPVLSLFTLEIMTTTWTPTKRKHRVLLMMNISCNSLPPLLHYYCKY